MNTRMYLEIKNIFNRPLTPHLTIYSSQITSLYSIWHRITGLSLIFSIILFFIFIKFNIYYFYQSIFMIFLWFPLWIKNSIYLNIIIFLVYHMLNGIRHILWDLGFFLPIKNVNISANLINFILVCFIFFFLLKIIN